VPNLPAVSPGLLPGPSVDALPEQVGVATVPRVLLIIDSLPPPHRPLPYWSEEDRDLAFNEAVGTQECVDDAFASWHREVAHAEEWLAGVGEEELGREFANAGRDDEVVRIRDLLVHMVRNVAEGVSLPRRRHAQALPHS
jgi:hypothetical protein